MVSACTNDELVVLIIGYNRPELVEKRLQDALDSDVENLFVSIDFSDSDTSAKIRKIVDSFTEKWPKQKKIESRFHVVNQGLTAHITETITELLQLYSEIIVIEDDIRFNMSSLESLQFGLKIMRENPQIASVGSYSGVPLPKSLQFGNKFRKSQYFACWGWATNRNIWKKYESQISKDEVKNKLARSASWKSLSRSKQETWLGRFIKISQNPLHTWDIQFQYMCFKLDLLNLLPIYPIVENVGFNDARSVHTTNNKPKWMIADNLSGRPISDILRNRVILKIISELESITLFGDNQKTIRRLHSVFEKISR